LTTDKNIHARIHNPLPVAREGFPFIGAGAGVTLICALLGLVVPAVIFGLLTLFITSFFRDPDRKPDGPEGSFYSPADGRIVKIARLTGSDNPLHEPCVLTSIFMTIFNVHVNRVVTDGRVTSIRYEPGKFFAANRDKASEQNERNLVTLETPDGRSLVIVQVAGLVARRIACWVAKGDRVAAGQRFGLIRFGSRLDVYLPEGTEIYVEMGQKVKAGTSVLGR